MLDPLPDRPTPAMTAAGAARLVAYLNCRPESATRWAQQLYEAMVNAHQSSPPEPSAQGAWPAEAVVNFLAEAVDTAKRLPGNLWPARLRAHMPEVVRSVAEAYAAQPARLKLGAPEQSAITRLDRVTDWLFWLSEDARRIVLARGNRTPWTLIARWDGRSERTLRYRHGEAIQLLVERLNRTTPRLHPFNFNLESKFRSTRRPAPNGQRENAAA